MKAAMYVSDQDVFGVTTLWKAILADTGATVLVTANALRLLRLGSGRLASKRIGQ
jgi:Zn2+/Cd2+-exporting ATPase